MLTPYNTNLPPDLRHMKDEIEGYARGYGLDFFETIFEVIDADDLNEVAAYGGFPTRYPHWSFGMAYEELRKGYDYGLSKIYEMVINNNPCYAYLMRSNHAMDQKLVMAHVYGHCDFFKNNAYFAHTNRKMMDEMANHGTRIRRYAEKYGEDEVERFMDRCMSIDDLIDVHSPAIKRHGDNTRYDFAPEVDESEQVRGTRFKSKDYMDDYINPREVLKKEEDDRRKLIEQTARNFPEHPEKDVLQFLIQHAALKPWQRDILEIVRDEAYYFAPQGQTKIINEGWACVHSRSFVLTDQGFRRMGDLVDERQCVQVSDGQQPRNVYDWAKFTNRETVRVTTRRGLTLEGSTTHRILLADGTWRALSDVQAGDQTQLAVGTNLWAQEYQAIDWQTTARPTLATVAAQAGVCPETVSRYRAGKRVERVELVSQLVAEYETMLVQPNVAARNRKPIRVPVIVDEAFGAFLGYLIGNGYINDTKRTLGLTTGDESLADHFAALVESLFGITPVKQWDETKWRVKFSSRSLRNLLVSLRLATGLAARCKIVPDFILRSPKSVIAAFLRALYDCDGYAGIAAGVMLSTPSVEMSKIVQLLLLNFGILSRRWQGMGERWQVQTCGLAVKVFGDEIGFGLARKQAALKQYLDDHQWFKVEPEVDEIVSVEHDRADVYDVSVAETHRYVAQGFVNHNSYWHSTMMTQKILHPSEVIDYADHHSGTMATSGGRLNPYKLGIELLRDLEERWNTGRFGKEYDECDDLDKKRAWNKELGLGRQKIFEVRRVHNDITFIDTFLTPEFCVRYNMFSFAFQEQAGQYYIESRDFEKVKQRLLFSLTNYGKPWIFVVDGNFRNRGELLLRHDFNGVELRLDQAKDTLANLQFIWGRPVNLNTLIDGKPAMLTFDGSEHGIKTGGEIDDPRKHAAGKTR